MSYAQMAAGFYAAVFLVGVVLLALDAVRSRSGERGDGVSTRSPSPQNLPQSTERNASGRARTSRLRSA